MAEIDSVAGLAPGSGPAAPTGAAAPGPQMCRVPRQRLRLFGSPAGSGKMSRREEQMNGREEGPALAPAVYGLDAAGFIQELEGLLTGNVAGFSIRLTENGSSIGLAGQNWAKEPQDGSEAWTPDTRMHVASLSKIVTAAAMTRLLGEAGISPCTPIIGYLPGYWVKGPDVDQITFAELLTHTSGLAFGATNSRSDFEWMKEQIAAGTTHLGPVQLPEHELRVVPDPARHGQRQPPPGLDRAGPASAGDKPPSSIDSLWDSSTISAYASYVASEVFAPSEVTGPDFTHDAADALAYNFPVTGNGWDSGDLTSMAGGAGWHMSVDELLQVMATFRRGGTIVSPEPGPGHAGATASASTFRSIPRSGPTTPSSAAGTTTQVTRSRA